MMFRDREIYGMNRTIPYLSPEKRTRMKVSLQPGDVVFVQTIEVDSYKAIKIALIPKTGSGPKQIK
jgi:hypothetical protein